METYTFTTSNPKGSIITVTVLKTFLEKCSDPAAYDVITLNKDFNMFTYLHNEHGPAIISTNTNLSNEMTNLISQGKYFLSIHEGKQLEFWLKQRCINRDNPKLAEEMFNKYLDNKKLNELTKGIL